MASSGYNDVAYNGYGSQFQSSAIDVNEQFDEGRVRFREFRVQLVYALYCIVLQLI